MKLSTEFEIFIAQKVSNEEIKSLAPDMLEALPSAISIDDDSWDMLPWSPRKTYTSINVHWNKFQNNEFIMACKTAILQKRINRNIKGNTAKVYVSQIYWLDQALAKRPIKTIVT